MTSLATNMSVRTNLQYIAVADLKNELFQYSTSTVNFKTTGTFTAPYTGLAGGIPAGTVLVETGKKLYRGPNPNVPTFLVQVMAFTNGSSTDGNVVRTPGNGQSLLDANNKAVFGFIDPSSPNVALYSVERNPDHADGLYYSSLALLTAGGNATTAAGYAAAGGVAHKGPSLFTGGTVTAGTGVTITGGPLTQKVAPSITTTSGEIIIDTTTGNIFRHTATLDGAVTYAVTGPVGSVFYILITNGGGQTVKFKAVGSGSATVFTTITAAGPGSVVMVQNAATTAITALNQGLITGVITVAAA